MKYRSNQTASTPALIIANTIIGGILFYSVYLTNMKGIGKGAMPMFAIPVGLMITAIYIFAYLIATDEKSRRTKWGFTSVFGMMTLAIFYFVQWF